jgi:hypothetical protein
MWGSTCDKNSENSSDFQSGNDGTKPFIAPFPQQNQNHNQVPLNTLEIHISKTFLVAYE